MATKFGKTGNVVSDGTLEQVVGGNRLETYSDGRILAKLGLLSEGDAEDCTPVREKIHDIGYKYKDKGGFKDNQYFDKNGNSVSRKDFWRGFATDHPELMNGHNIEDLLKIC